MLENTVKLLRCEGAQLANKCSGYCSESPGVFKMEILNNELRY